MEYSSTDEAYLIRTAKGLASFASLVNGAEAYAGATYMLSSEHSFGTAANDISGTLINDIDLSEICGEDIDVSWTPIGNSNAAYKGTFDGDGYNISNLYIKNESDNQGLFGYVVAGTVKNLNVEGYVSAVSNVGGIVGGKDQYEAINISNCSYSGSVEGSGNCVGGIIGYGVGNYKCYISNCVNSSTVIAGVSYAGGIIGSSGSQYGYIEYCGNSGTVTAKTSCAGGITGRNYNGDLRYCYNIGTITATTEYTGGVAGYQSSYSATNCSGITNNYNTGTVNGGKSVGGITGHVSNFDTISNCYNSGTVTSSDNSYFGGLYGSASGGNSSGSITVSIGNCYYASDKITNATNGGGTAKTTEEMRDGTFAKLLGDDIYQEDVDPQINDGYPILIWQVATE